VRDDFSKPTREALAKRAAFFCSNPDCLVLTTSPHASDAGKSVNTGHAAHIHAASPEGPRYDPAQTPAQRKAIGNGIWLCRNCGPRVDTDAASYTADMLRGWKREHEALILDVSQQGQARSLEMLLAHRRAARDAAKLVALLDNHTALWEVFDIENPERVRQSLDRLRDNLTSRRTDLPPGSPVDAIFLEIIRAIQAFYRGLQHVNLSRLRCDSGDPTWRRFATALGDLRRDVIGRVIALAQAHDVHVSPELVREGQRLSAP